MRTPTSKQILVVDDEAHQRDILSHFLGASGHQVATAENGKQALKILQEHLPPIDLVITDLAMPEMDGIELIQQGKACRPEVGFLFVTAHGTIETAVKAIKAGAFDYLSKPVEFSDLSLRLQNWFALKALEARTELLERENVALRGDSDVIAESPEMRALLAEIRQVAKTDTTVLLTGETGTGKELAARYLHDHSTRAQRPFVAVNCSAVPENLLESEFFGHERGAFTGADRRATGLFQRADGGTLLLDEIGEMDLKLQAKLLRVLEERRIRRVGSSVDEPVDVRVVAATHRDLKQMSAENQFRQDLYFRLTIVPVNIPPLRERRGDIPALVRYLVKKYASRLNVKVSRIDESYLEALRKHEFPGNVRELANLVERSLIYLKGDALTAESLPADLVRRGPVLPSLPHPNALKKNLSELLSSYERQVLLDSLEVHGKDVEAVSKALGVSRSSLYSKLSKHGLR